MLSIKTKESIALCIKHWFVVSAILWVLTVVIAQFNYMKTGHTDPMIMTFIEFGSKILAYYLWLYLLPKFSWTIIRGFYRTITDVKFLKNVAILAVLIYIRTLLK